MPEAMAGMLTGQCWHPQALDNCNYRDHGDSISPCDSDGSFDTTDVDFVLRDGTISAHRCVLCARSEYFARMFRWGEGSQSDTTAARAQPRVRIRVPDACCAAFRSLLRFAYCSSISPLSSKRDDVAAVAADSAIMHDDAREAWDETTGGRLEPMREVETKPAQNQLSGTEALELVLLARRYMMEELVDKARDPHTCMLSQLARSMYTRSIYARTVGTNRVYALQVT
eukprot:2020972-Pleurochrysis_carterae.AAC.3